MGTGSPLTDTSYHSSMPDTSDLDAVLRSILTSRVYDVARKTTLELAPRLSAQCGNTVLIKREDL